MNNRRTWIIAATLAVLAGGGCWWAFADGEDAALITAPARVAGLEKTVQAVGRVNPKELVAVGAQVSGQVTRLHVVLGQHVQAGDLIAEVDSQPQRIALRSAEAAANALRAQHAASQARYRQALRTYDRQSQLVASRLVSQEGFEAARVARDAARADAAALQAQIDQAVTQVETARINLGYTRIVSPSEGYIVAIVTKAGQTLNSMQTTPTIVMLAQMDTMTVRAEIAEADVELIAPGQPLPFLSSDSLRAVSGTCSALATRASWIGRPKAATAWRGLRPSRCRLTSWRACAASTSASSSSATT